MESINPAPANPPEGCNHVQSLPGPTTDDVQPDPISRSPRYPELVEGRIIHDSKN